MSRSIKTEAIVLRSIRYSEADRILHLYTPEMGRINAIAKGSRKPRSRFGGRLEPFFRLDLMLHQGRSDLATVTGATTLDGYPSLRLNGPAINAASRACDAVSRLLDSIEPNRPAYNLLRRYLDLLDGEAGGGSRAGAVGEGVGNRATSVAFRIKLALSAGFAPELGSCARCGESEGITAFSGAAGGVVCGACERDAFPIGAEAHEFMVAALGRPIAELPAVAPGSLAQVERAIGDILTHHAQVQLRSAG